MELPVLTPTEKIIKKSCMEILTSLITFMEAKDPFQSGHSDKVTKYTKKFALALNLPAEELEIIEYASLLHDIGKVGINDTIFYKPSSLSFDEWIAVKSHPVIGGNIVHKLPILRAEEPGIRYHHERFDGQGYPEGLKGENIPLIARIICIADTFDALTSPRPYRAGLSRDKAKDEIKKFMGVQFDPKLAEVFLSII